MKLTPLAVAAASLLIVAAVIAPGANAQQATFRAQLTLPSHDIYDAVFASPDVVWAAGAGAIFRSDDGGRSWQDVQDAATFGAFFAMAAAPDGVHGWAVGGNGAIAGTADGGRTWQHQVSGTSVNLGVVAALGNESAIAAGYRTGFSDAIRLEPKPNVILRTDDFGASWHEIRIDGDYSINTIDALPDGKHVWMAGERCIAPTGPDAAPGCNALEYALLRSNDGGASWQALPESLILRGVSFVDANVGWATANNCVTPSTCANVIVRTTDGGTSWRVVHSVSGQTALGDVHGFDEHSAAVAEQSCSNTFTACEMHLLETSDDGATWPTVSTREPDTTVLVSADRQHGIWAGFAPPQFTADGAAWQDATFPLSSGTGAFDFVDPSRGWFAASKLLRTTDGGATWAAVSDLQPVALSFITATEGWSATRTCNAQGCDQIDVYHTADGGASWAKQFTTDFGSLPTVHFADARNGWLASPSFDHKLFHTRDGGATWYEQALPAADDMDVAFAGPNVIWGIASTCAAVTQACPPRTFRSVDGGDTWQRVADLAPAQLCGSESIATADAAHAWVAMSACGADGRPSTVLVSRTVDGGRTWRPATVGTLSFTGLRSFNGAVGRAIGQACGSEQCVPEIWRTSDGGATWTSQRADSNPATGNFGAAAEFASPEHVWVFAQLGGGLFDIAQQQLFAFAGTDSVLTPLPKVSFPDTGAAAGDGSPLRWWIGVAVLAAAGVLAGLAGVALERDDGHDDP